MVYHDGIRHVCPGRFISRSGTRAEKNGYARRSPTLRRSYRARGGCLVGFLHRDFVDCFGSWNGEVGDVRFKVEGLGDVVVSDGCWAFEVAVFSVFFVSLFCGSDVSWLTAPFCYFARQPWARKFHVHDRQGYRAYFKGQ